jgi:PIN domain
MRSVQKRYPDVTREQVERIRDLMNEHAPDCIVCNYEDLITGLTLPDPDDRHVLAAAVRAEADIIVTFNLPVITNARSCWVQSGNCTIRSFPSRATEKLPSQVTACPRTATINRAR